jgi:hypothetical protein
MTGLQVEDHVRINHPGWCGDGEIGRIEYFGQLSTGAYVRVPDRKCYRHELKFLTQVSQPDCKLGCCRGPIPWDEQIPVEITHGRGALLRNPILDL